MQQETDINARIPHTVGIIMDGNRRWAKEQGKEPIDGHAAGYEKLKELVQWAHDAGVQEVIVYAFSTENWRRSETERAFLFKLIRRALTEELAEFKENGVRLRVLGQRDRFPDDLRELMEKAERDTEHNSAITLGIALSYGGRAEIVEAAQRACTQGGADGTTEAAFTEQLWSSDFQDIDLILRTGGEKRLSNFMLWKAAYSELFFTNTYWPAFSKEEFAEILAEYANRERRMGA